MVVLGAPLGLSSTVTSGIVSALDRTIEVPGDNGQSALLVSAVQTDAAINPGNSGGAMTNCSGQLIGVPSAGASVPSPEGGSSAGSVGLGFAIPVDLAKAISDEIIATGTNPSHGYFGIQVVTIPPAAAQKSGTPEGLYVAGVVPGRAGGHRRAPGRRHHHGDQRRARDRPEPVAGHHDHPAGRQHGSDSVRHAERPEDDDHCHPGGPANGVTDAGP